MKTGKRWISFLLMLYLILSSAPGALGAEEEPMVTITGATTSPGGYVYLYISGTNLPEIAALDLEIYYDSSAMCMSSTYNGDLLSGALASVHTDTAGVIKVSAIWTTPISGNGNFLTVVLKVNSDAATGSYPVEVAVGDAYNGSFQPVVLGGNSAMITVEVAETPAQKESFYASLSFPNGNTFQQGDSFAVSMCSGSQPFASADMILEYDAELFSVESVKLRDELVNGNAVYSINTAVAGQVRISYASITEVSAYTLAEVVLRVNANVTTSSSLNFEVKDVYREDHSSYRPGEAKGWIYLNEKQITADYPNLYLIMDTITVGEQGNAILCLEAGAAVAAADFAIAYDPSVLRCVSISVADAVATNGGMVILNPNYADGLIRFSYVNMLGYDGGLELLHIQWEAVSSPSNHTQIKPSGTGVVDLNFCSLPLEYVSAAPCVLEIMRQEPTCGMDGAIHYLCSACGEGYSEVIPSSGHDYTALVTAPTCTVNGYTTYTCHCGDSYVADEVAALGHSYVVTETAPTCTEDGSKVYTCHCGDIYTEVLPATGHKYEAVVTAPTCTENGYTTYTCHCGDTYVADEVAALGHSYEMVETAPTCTEDGSRVYTCHCGDSYTEVIPAIGHDYVSVVTEPTCTEKGYTTHTCTNCGATYTSDHVDALGHNYEAVVTAPTCTDGGYTTYTCHCGDSYVSDHTEATGHSWDEGVITKEPTTEAEGEKTYTCQHCGATKTEVLPKKEPVIYDTPADDSVTIPENDCFEGGTVVTVEVIVEGERFAQVAEVMEAVAESYVAYEFTATKDEVAVQPNGKLTVTFDIPADYSTNITVYYMAEDGKLEKLDAVVDAETRTVTVELEHFSTYIVVDEDTAPAYVLGDVNGDGRINARDARALLRFIAGLTEEGEVVEAAADYNGDGRVNARDARALLRAIAGLD